MDLTLIDKLNVKNQIILLRIDGNVPYNSLHEINNDYRLQSIRLTLDYLLAEQAIVILLTHQGRPDLSKSIEEQERLSNKHLLPWFKKNNYHPLFFESIEEGLAAAKKRTSPLILLENLRFFKEEIEQNISWAKQFSATASIYINDAFSTVHRTDSSIALFPQLIKTKGIGFALQKELENLKKLTTEIEHPFILIIGGNKNDKLSLIKKILEKKQNMRPQKILCGGMIGLYFLMAEKKLKQNNETENITLAKQLLIIAKKQDVSIILPIDHSFKNDQIVDIGPQTIALFNKEIKKTKTIFFNGTMGIYEDSEGITGTDSLLKTIAQSDLFSVVGGGNAVDAVFQIANKHNIDLISTGGGATLAFIAAQDPYKELPGLAALLKQK